MSTIDLAPRGSGDPHRRRVHSFDARGRATAIGTRAPTLLGGALLLLILYAAFAHGAIQSPSEARLQVLIAAVAAISGAGWLWSGTLRLRAPALALTGIGLLAAFAAWTGATVLWSVAPDQTWIELNRALSYVIVLGLAIAVGASHSRSVELIAKGFLSVALVVSAYALGQKLIPGVHLFGLVDFNQTGPLPRLQEPLGYWNALALFIAMGTPVALALAADASLSVRLRLASLGALELMLLAIAFTYSRGGVLALVLALAAGIALSGSRLRSLMWLGVAFLAALAPLIFGLLDDSLTSAGVALSHRELAGAELTGFLLASLVALYFGARKLIGTEQRLRFSEQQMRGIVRLLLSSLGTILAVGVLVLALSNRGIDGTISHAWKSFTATRAASVYDPHRLLSADSENRWVWWKEAAGAFSDRPLAGWGAGSFAVVHLLYRRDTITVKQPHSVPLQLLAETGVVGLLLAIGGFALLLAAGTATVRRKAPGSERLLGAALLAGALAYAVHASYDWDWDIPGVTLPALLLIGVLAGSAQQRHDQAPPLHAEGPATGVRVLALATLTLMLCLFALSAALPSLASSDASSAVVAAAGSSPAQLRAAQVDAELASNLDPLSDAGPKAAATIALHRGQVSQARSDVLQAIRRQPSDAQAWQELAVVELFVGDVAGVQRAAKQALTLDPRGADTANLTQRANILTAPPRGSATAVPTPLPGR